MATSATADRSEGRACRALRCRAGSRAARDTMPHAKPCATGTRCRVGMLRASGPSHSKWDSVPSRGKWDSGPQPHRPPELVVRFLHPCQRLPRLGARVHGLARRGLRMGCVVAQNAALRYGVRRAAHEACNARSAPTMWRNRPRCAPDVRRRTQAASRQGTQRVRNRH